MCPQLKVEAAGPQRGLEAARPAPSTALPQSHSSHSQSHPPFQNVEVPLREALPTSFVRFNLFYFDLKLINS